MKVAIDDIARFVKEGWPGPNWYIDDCGPSWEAKMSDDGETPRTPGEIVKLEDFECSVCYQGKDHPTRGSGHPFTTLFRKWYRGLSVVTIVAEAPKDKAEAIRAAIIAAGGKVTA
jgi:hypothetical protein